MAPHCLTSPDTPHILCVNPWIHDFAAYDFWARPMGLLMVAAWLRSAGFRVSLIDCLDRFHPALPSADPFARCGRGPYLKTRIPNPPGLEDIPRTYCRYGVPPAVLHQDLAALGADPPHLILVSSMMTYWYPGVFETIAVLRRHFPNTPLILGGIYARLYPDHARRHSGADAVWTDADPDAIIAAVAESTGFAARPPFDPSDLNAHPYPALDLCHRLPFVPLLTARGCPNACAYCAARFLEPRRRTRRPEAVMAEIAHWHERFGVRDFAFYDDALLADSEALAAPLFEAVIRSGYPLRFHTPNAVHIRYISSELARLMARAGMTTLRLGLETADFAHRGQMDRKVTAPEFARAVARLAAAGLGPDRVGAYLLAGLPDQPMAAVRASIRAVRERGIAAVPTYYSPIPHTALWEKALAASRYDLAADPIFTNNAIFPCMARFSWRDVSELKRLANGRDAAGLSGFKRD